MAIVNLTDDSYFAESRCGGVEAALQRIGRLVEEGADIIDIGACSSRPGSVPIGPEQEWDRLRPVLEAVKARFPEVRISVDTYWSSVVEKVHGLIGDFIVNDISAGEDDPAMLPTVGRLGLEYVAMHKRGTSMDMQYLTDYQDVVGEITEYFKEFAVRAEKAGVRNWILDPGFGFAKTVEQNYQLLASLRQIRSEVSMRGNTSLRGASATWQSPRILVGISRKSMIYKPLGLSPEDVLPATQAVHMAALIGGADILRVHDVKEAKQTISLFEYIESASV